MTTVRIRGLKELQNLLGRYAQISAPHIQEAISKSLLQIEREGKKAAPVDTGRLRNSFVTEIKPLRGEVGPNVDYALSVHEGTRPHWPNWRPGSPLADWSRRHGIPAYLVARKISRKGTKPNPFLSKAVKSSVRKIESFFDQALEKTHRDIARKVNSAP